MVKNNLMLVEVAYAREDVQRILAVEIAVGSTIEATIKQSGILELFPEIDLNSQKIGVFGKIKLLSEMAATGDRIEIYRPLKINPMDARREKAKIRSKN